MNVVHSLGSCAYPAIVAVLLSGCANYLGPPKEYGTAPTGWVRNSSTPHPKYSRVVKPNDVVRQGFIDVLKEECADIDDRAADVAYGPWADQAVSTTTKVASSSDDRSTTTDTIANEDDQRVADFLNPKEGAKHNDTVDKQTKSDTQGKNDVAGSTQEQSVLTHRRRLDSSCDDDSSASIDGSSFRCWAKRHRKARLCADRITRVAIDQCITKSGIQNAFTATANVYLGSFLAAASLAADGAAIVTPRSNPNINAALAANVASGANNSRNLIPATISPKVSDMISAEQNYLLVSDIEEDDVEKVSSIKIDMQAQLRRDSYTTDKTARKFSRLRDAVYSACPVSAY